MVVSGVASFRLWILESAFTYQNRSPVPVKAGARMRTGAPLEYARNTPAAPTPPPMSAEPEITAWMVSPAPCVPTVSSTRLYFLKMPASWPSVGAWFSQLLICPIAILSWSSAKAVRADSTKGAASPYASVVLRVTFIGILPLLIRRHPPHRPHSTPEAARRGSPSLYRRRGLARLLFRAAGRAGLPAAAFGRPPALATRIDQYSQARVSPVVLPVICAARSASPGVSGPM